ncbi:MAG: zinc dependent phospholipase C family protein [Mucilaginibacter sp.]|uniref:zinc dependent phospholipase C family protein n=1 Tax=Mucilaginibacter sp. L3T2-6 TaxID=3062491 RepID=UPI002674D12C|nr:zinc dependent phospholipase C family protein [Mucilaginibacter sp. L3T2-6]MDO3643008.1 zinc dependent phospholipase C family protein [Mucilaginibacter sp. L3T2-6]MDV6215775.1 zinc dependent phospholipase C family protein [Mucilaginibacter sp. L3T2-6]
MIKPFVLRVACVLAVTFMLSPISAGAYSVLTHEALIDASWANNIKPLLKLKFPKATEEDLKKAHAYAYGGCLLPDMGYFPFGSLYFTNLAHYVRSGDFVENLLNESQNINEYAFALGALCHYMADKYGHSIGTNHVVPIVYPKMKAKFGNIVTYGENHISHSRVELSFDVLEVAKGNYAAEAYHDFIGFEVARPVLERAFLKTYGEDINNVFGDLDLAISTYRWSVKSLMPTVTRAAWRMRKDEILKANPAANAHSFHYKMKRKAYIKEFGSSHTTGTLGQKLVAFLIRILPKVGPLKALTFKDPGPKGEETFIKSFDTVLVHYHGALSHLHKKPLELPDVDYDTGKPTHIGEYELADMSYAKLIENLEESKFTNLTANLKRNIVNFYDKADTAAMSKKYPKDWKKTYSCLQALRSASVIVPDSLKTAKGLNYKLIPPTAADKQTGGQ